jgi:hypothetical protein
MDDIDVDQFVAEEIESLRRFAAMWKSESANDPEIWPANMRRGEWDEQFRSYEGA